MAQSDRWPISHAACTPRFSRAPGLVARTCTPGRMTLSSCRSSFISRMHSSLPLSVSLSDALIPSSVISSSSDAALRAAITHYPEVSRHPGSYTSRCAARPLVSLYTTVVNAVDLGEAGMRHPKHVLRVTAAQHTISKLVPGLRKAALLTPCFKRGSSAKPPLRGRDRSVSPPRRSIHLPALYPTQAVHSHPHWRSARCRPGTARA